MRRLESTQDEAHRIWFEEVGYLGLPRDLPPVR
jgi:hypothetical protein